MIVELRFGEIDPKVTLLRAPFKTKVFADEIVNVYTPRESKNSLYLLRSTILSQHTLQVYYSDEMTGQLVFVAKFSQAVHKVDSESVLLQLQMAIHDIRIFKGSIVIADFNNGLVVMDILFRNTFAVEKFNVSCAMMDFNRTSHIYVETKWETDIIMITRVNPAAIFEIDLTDL